MREQPGFRGFLAIFFLSLVTAPIASMLLTWFFWCIPTFLLYVWVGLPMEKIMVGGTVNIFVVVTIIWLAAGCAQWEHLLDKMGYQHGTDRRNIFLHSPGHTYANSSDSATESRNRCPVQSIRQPSLTAS